MFYITSDLHYGISPEGDAAVRRLACSLARATPDDVLLLGGDIATTDEKISECLGLFGGFPGIKAAIAGNHDVWVDPPMNGHRSPQRNSWNRYCELPERFRAAGFHALEAEPLITRDGIGIVGAMGWYDYSLRDEIGVPLECYEQKFCSEFGVTWNDRLYVRWQFTDQEMTELQVHRLARHLDAVNGARESLVLIHHVPTKRLLVHPRAFVPRAWRFANAFLGSDRFAETITRYPRVRHVVNGHIHLATQAAIGLQKFTSIGGSYETKQLLVISGDSVARQTFFET